MEKITYTFNLQLFAVLSNGVNGTVSEGSTGAITTDGSGGTYPYANHAYTHPNNDLTPEMKVYYDKTLIEEAQPQLVHAQFGQKRPIPQGSGKTIEFRKFDSLPKALTPITEGVTPNGQALKVTAIPATVEQYGAYVGLTDMLELTAIDPMVVEATKLIGQQAGQTLDTLVRNKLLEAPSEFFCPIIGEGGVLTPVADFDDITKGARLTVRQVKKIVAELRGVNAPTINGDYVAIIHPFAALDLMNDETWEDIQNYASPENRLAGEIGRIAGVRFVETTEAKIYRPYVMLGDEKVYNLNVKTATGGSSTTEITVKEAIPTASGISAEMYINGSKFTITAVTYNAEGSKLTVTEDAKNIAANTPILPDKYFSSKDGYPVYCTIFLGANAYGITEIDGGGLRTIIKQKGSGGTSDPLDQRSTVGWKAIQTAEILLPAYIIKCLSSSDEIDGAEGN